MKSKERAKRSGQALPSLEFQLEGKDMSDYYRKDARHGYDVAQL